MEIKVSKEFLADFDAVMEYYDCDAEEIEGAKKTVRARYEECRESYKKIAEWVRFMSIPCQEETGVSLKDITLDKNEEEISKKSKGNTKKRKANNRRSC